MNPAGSSSPSAWSPPLKKTNKKERFCAHSQEFHHPLDHRKPFQRWQRCGPLRSSSPSAWSPPLKKTNKKERFCAHSQEFHHPLDHRKPFQRWQRCGPLRRQGGLCARHRPRRRAERPHRKGHGPVCLWHRGGNAAAFPRPYRAGLPGVQALRRLLLPPSGLRNRGPGKAELCGGCLPAYRRAGYSGAAHSALTAGGAIPQQGAVPGGAGCERSYDRRLLRGPHPPHCALCRLQARWRSDTATRCSSRWGWMRTVI